MAREVKKKKKIGWIIALAVIALLAAVGLSGWNMLKKEHTHIRSLEIQNIDFSTVADGEYIGEYAGGIYGWRENQVKVTVENGKVTDIEIIYTKDGVPDEITAELYGRVIDAQSLNVDAVSEATITSKAYLKSVEDALTDGGN